MSPSECATRWWAMRNKFGRELKKVKGHKSSDAGPVYSPSWPLFDVILFLTDTVKHRKLVGLLVLEQCFSFHFIAEVTQISQHQSLMTQPETEMFGMIK